MFWGDDGGRWWDFFGWILSRCSLLFLLFLSYQPYSPLAANLSECFSKLICFIYIYIHREISASEFRVFMQFKMSGICLC